VLGFAAPPASWAVWLVVLLAGYLSAVRFISRAKWSRQTP
jgi:hypothetical protein